MRYVINGFLEESWWNLYNNIIFYKLRNVDDIWIHETLKKKESYKWEYKLKLRFTVQVSSC